MECAKQQLFDSVFMNIKLVGEVYVEKNIFISETLNKIQSVIICHQNAIMCCSSDR